MAIRTWVLALLFAVGFIAGCSGPQHTAGTTDQDAPIGSEVIVVEMEPSQSDAYRMAGRVLQDHGFQIESSDSDLGSIRTAPFSNDDLFGPVRDVVLSVSVREGEVHLRGTYAGSTSITKRGQSGSPARKAWASMHMVAEDMGVVAGYE